MHAHRLIGALLAFILIPLSAAAHRLNETYVYFNVSDETFSGRFEATFDDINTAMSIDDNGDGEVSEEEFRAHADRIFAFFEKRLTLATGGTTHAIEFSHVSRLGTAEGAFGQVWFDVPTISPVPDAIEMSYKPLSDVITTGHAGFALIESNTRLGLEDNERYISLVFQQGDGPKTLSLVGEPLGKLFMDFLTHGVWHIWLGFDHLIFLLTLLLPAVMWPREGRWAPLESFPPALRNVVGIVTVFTISHSITLTLAALGIIQLPVVFVESVIAISIAVVAIMNLFPSMHARVLWVVFGFGLFHGFGFANVLAPLGLAPSQLLVGLVAFNIGVELGQLAIVLVAFPILWVLRRWSLYSPLALKLGSVAMVALAGIWLLERTTEFEWNVRATLAFFTGLVT